MRELTPMYRIENILARNNSRNREAFRCVFSTAGSMTHTNDYSERSGPNPSLQLTD